MIASTATQPAARREASGKRGRQKRIIPYVPIFSSTPASITEPAVGASTCASGSQVCSGKSGTLIANARKNAKKNQKRKNSDVPSESDTPTALTSGLRRITNNAFTRCLMLFKDDSTEIGGRYFLRIIRNKLIPSVPQW